MGNSKTTARDTPMRVVEAARQNVASRFHQVYHINAILNGDWDNGYLIVDEVERITLLAPEETEDQDVE